MVSSFSREPRFRSREREWCRSRLHRSCSGDGLSEVLGAGIAFPLHLEDGKLSLAHDEDDVEQAVLLILSTAPGERPMRPEFGCALQELAFDRIDSQTTGRIEREIRVALDRWEPRIDVESIEFDF